MVDSYLIVVPVKVNHMHSELSVASQLAAA